MQRSLLASAFAIAMAGAVTLAAQDKVKAPIPQPGVPEIVTMEGKFVRAAYNNEGYVIIGYQVANRSIGDKFMMLDMGTTVRDGVPEFDLKRDAISVTTPDNQTVPMMTVEAYRAADMRAVENRARVQRDSINYFPPSATQACRIGFFAEPGRPAMAWDQVAVSNRRACGGKLFFEIPGGIVYGQYFLNVQFKNTQIRVPFRIITADEEKVLSKNYGDIRKQIKAAFQPKKK